MESTVLGASHLGTLDGTRYLPSSGTWRNNRQVRWVGEPEG